MHAFGDLAAELRIVRLLDTTHAIVAQRLIQEPRPQIQRRHLLLRQIGEAPRLVSVVRLGIVVVAHRLIQVDHAAHELRAEHADGAEVEQVHRRIRPHLIIAEMRIAVDHPVAIERHIPGAEQRLGDAVALLLRRILGQALHQRPAIEPGHGQQAPRAVVLDRHRHMHRRIVRQHQPVQPHLRGFALVVEFLAQAFASVPCRPPRAGWRCPCGDRSPSPGATGAGRLRRCSACRDIAACTRRRVPSCSRARCTWPRLAAAAASWPKLANFACQSGPSSLAMRRRTKFQPIGGALA